MTGHTYTVEFRIWGPTLTPEQVSRDLGLVPCQTRSPLSEPVARSSDGMWAYNGPLGMPKEWPSLEEGLLHVLEGLWPQRDKISRYQDTSKIVWWCGHFQSAFDGGPALSVGLMGKLAEFGADLYIDNYFSEGDSAGETS